MNPTELFQLIVTALAGLPMDLDTEQGQRTYLAYLVARHGSGVDSTIEVRIAELRAELGL